MKNSVHTKKIKFYGLYISGSLDLLKHFPSLKNEQPPVVADITQGQWRGDDIAIDLCSQLSIDYNTCIQDTKRGRMQTSSLSLGAIVGMGVDSEAKGDQAIRSSYILANIVANKIINLRSIIILIDKTTTNWSKSNYYFLYFLGSILKLNNNPIFFVSLGPVFTNLLIDWKVEWKNCPVIPLKKKNDVTIQTSSINLVPGIITSESLIEIAPSKKELDQTTLPLGQCYLIRPEYRPNISSINKLDFDKLASIVNKNKVIKAYAQYHGNNFFMENELLVSVAWELYLKGGSSLSQGYMLKALSCSTDTITHSIILVQLQGMRIGSNDFIAASEESDPSLYLPQNIQSLLFFLKAWGLVMVGKNNLADYCFEKSTSLDGYKKDMVEECYEHNIQALNQLRIGNFDNALLKEQLIEKKIKKKFNETGEIDYRLVYINKINTARLLRRSNDISSSEAYYNQAFYTTFGNQTDNDFIYKEVCLARLKSDKQKYDESLELWLNAALYWISSEVPEAIGIRTFGGITDGTKYQNKCDVASVTGGFIEHILHTSEHLGLSKSLIQKTSLDIVPEIHSINRINESNLLQSRVFSAGIISFVDIKRANNLPIKINNFYNLRVIVFKLLYQVYPWLQRFKIGKAIAIDTRQGRGIAKSKVEILETMINYSITSYIISNCEQKLNILDLENLFKLATISISPAVSSYNLKDRVVFYKRYLPPRKIDINESKALIEINEKPSIKIYQLEKSVKRELILKLLDSKILVFNIGDEGVYRLASNSI